MALLCSVHSTQLCKTRRRRRHRRRHRTFSRFNCKCFRIVLRSLEARGTASPLHHPRVPRNYDIVLNRVCACCRRWFYFFFFFIIPPSSVAETSFLPERTIFFAFRLFSFCRSGLAAAINPTHAFMVPKEALHIHSHTSRTAHAQSPAPSPFSCLMFLFYIVSSVWSSCSHSRSRSRCFLILLSFYELNCARRVKMCEPLPSTTPRFKTF